METVAAAFDSEQDARRAYAELQDAGIPGDDIGMVLREHAGEYERREDFVHGAEEWLGSGIGAAVGGTGGWIAGAAAAGAAVAVPVVGPVLALGALAGIVSAAGGTLGWLAGGLVSKGFEQNDAKFLQDAVEAGSIVLAVHTDRDNVGRVQAILDRNNGRVSRTR